MELTVDGNPSYLLQAIQESVDVWNADGNSNFTFNITSQGNLTTANDDTNTVIIGNYKMLYYGLLCQPYVLGASIYQPPSPKKKKPGVDPEGPEYYEIIERDLVICNTWDWYVGEKGGINGGQMDLVSVLLHELGHHFGLGHSNYNGNPYSCDGLADTGAIMDTCVLTWGATRRDLLNKDADNFIDQGDAQAIQHIYGAYDPGTYDDDGDGVVNKDDNCPKVSNPGQFDMDADGAGDACDSDADGDGLTKEEEDSIGTSDLNTDTDDDGLSDYEEHIVYGTNPLDQDTDGDGISDFEEIQKGTDPLKPDNPAIMIVIQFLLDDDDDNDGISDWADNCPSIYNPDQEDFDNDGIGDACDLFNMTAEQFEALINSYKTLREIMKKKYWFMFCIGTGDKPEWCESDNEGR